jgi:hypothetical protein
MSSLTQAALVSRKVLIVLGMLFVIAVSVILMTLFSQTVRDYLLPVGPQPATIAFGKIDPFDYSEGVPPQQGINYSIETISGNLPDLDDKGNVFKVGVVAATFGARERAIINARKLEFFDPPQEIDSGVLRFFDLKNPNRTLTMNIFTKDFLLESDFIDDPKILEKTPQVDSEAINTAIGFLKSFGYDFSDFPRDLVITKRLRIEGGELIDALSLASSNLLRVEFFMSDLNGFPVFVPKEGVANIFALVSRELDFNKSIVYAKGEVLPIQKHEFASYPLKGTEKAFEDLKAGKAAFFRDIETNRFVIIDVALGYVVSSKNDKFLQPVYLFEGPIGYFAYVAAVDDNWITAQPTGSF